MAASTTLTPSEKSQRARMGGYAVAAKYDTKALTQPARAARDQKFIDEVDPDGKLPQEERDRRVEAARTAYFTKLAYQSARARRKSP